MNFSFGYCLGPDSISEGRLTDYLHSIWVNFLSENDSDVEIIISGEITQDCFGLEENYPRFKFVFHDFEDNLHKPWITKKKNQIAQIARHDNLFITHDYYYFGEGVINQFIANARLNVDLYMFPIVNNQGQRHSDWLINPNNMQRFLDAYPEYKQILMDAAPYENAPKYVCGLPYNEKSLIRYQYISGGFICCKRHVIIEEPLNETLYWGDAEDLEWSERVLKRFKYDMIPFGKIFITKQNKWVVTQIPDDVLIKIKSFFLKGTD
jgi:hypothetical protein